MTRESRFMALNASYHGPLHHNGRVEDHSVFSIPLLMVGVKEKRCFSIDLNNDQNSFRVLAGEQITTWVESKNWAISHCFESLSFCLQLKSSSIY